MIETIKNNLEQLITEFPIYIYKVVFEEENNSKFLKVILDSYDVEIDLDLCVKITKIVNDYLDEHEPIKDEYTLEVSSRGIESDITTIEEIAAAVGNHIFVKTYSKVCDKKEFIGKLINLLEDEIIIECNNKGIIKQYQIKLSLIAHMRYSVEF
ncbi:MAG: ribosome maturation factor RimP [Bacilli bacterium]